MGILRFANFAHAELMADWADAKARLGDAATTADLPRTHAQRAAEVSARLVDVLTLTVGGDNADGTGPVLHVPQPAAESAGTTP